MPSTHPMPESPKPGRRYVLICPCKDEAEHAQATIDSLAAQSELPALCLFVDDGSTDETPEILDRAAEKYPWFRVLHRKNTGARRVGPGVIEAFYEGYNSLDMAEFDYVCKIDADLEFPPRYFELVMDKMESHPRFGNYSGKLYLRLDDGRLVPEPTGDENAVGNAKFFRVECFEDIGGFAKEVGWDGIDGHMCRLKNWIAQSEEHPDLHIIHRRMMGSSFKGIFHGRQRWGRAKWYMGTGPVYMLVVTAYRMAQRPFIIGGLGIMVGYIKSWLTGYPRHGTPEFRRALRRFEHRSLIKGKAAAAREANEKIKESWDRHHPSHPSAA
ncbi:MAG TPA: glycosyltransferase family 2 protein [Phycisphaerales bacterium]|nr:glycosyltransferase family 2 protein [Phycisphaerales bacterium]